MTNSILSFNDISFHYENNAIKKTILKKLNLEVYEGEFISFLGPSGSGKSTLFKLITGLEQPSEGEIFLRSQLVINRLGHVGYMPQQDLLLPWRTIMENAALPLEIKGMKKREAHTKVSMLLEEFGLKGVENCYPSDLSGGMRQRVSFLRTILSGSNILLLDEPFSALDAITKLSLQEWLLAQWQKRKETILFITHDVNEALFLSDRIYVFPEAPATELKEIKVPLKRPRHVKDINHPDILRLKDGLLDELRLRQKL